MCVCVCVFFFHIFTHSNTIRRRRLRRRRRRRRRHRHRRRRRRHSRRRGVRTCIKTSTQQRRVDGVTSRGSRGCVEFVEGVRPSVRLSFREAKKKKIIIIKRNEICIYPSGARLCNIKITHIHVLPLRLVVVWYSCWLRFVIINVPSSFCWHSIN